MHRAWADVQRSGGGAPERGHDGEHAGREYCAEDGRAGGGVCVHGVQHEQYSYAPYSRTPPHLLRQLRRLLHLRRVAHSLQRLCCCLDPSDAAASTVCATSAADCDASTWWDATNKLCVPTAAGCPAGWWHDSSAASTCVPCPSGTFGPLSGQTSELAACTGTCGVGQYGTSLTVAGMRSACTDCPSWGAATPAGSSHCVGTPLVGWLLAPQGVDCDTACANDLRAGTTCQEPRLNAVSDAAALTFVNAGIKADRGDGAGAVCGSYVSSSSSYAPYVSGTTCRYKSGPPVDMRRVVQLPQPLLLLHRAQ